MSRVKRRNHGRSHSYYLLNDDGIESKLDGVTTLIGEGLAKPALVNWAGNVTAAYAVDHWNELGQLPVSQRLERLKKARYEDRDLAAAKGTEIHALAEEIIHGRAVDVPEPLRGHVESAVRFLDDYQARPVLTEATVCSPQHGYAGTLDMVITTDVMPDRVLLCDWKTSRSGIYSEAALQLAAYANAKFYQDTDGEDYPVASLGITDHWGVWIRADGYSVLPLDRSPNTFETFRYVVAVARRARAMKEAPLVGAEMERPVLA